MHYYLFDERATSTMSAKQLGRLQSLIKTSQVAGEQHNLKSPQQIIELAKKIAQDKKNPTVIALGDDLSLDLVISGVQASRKPAVVGFIPTVANSKSASRLQIKDWRHGLKILSKRKTKNFDLLVCNEHFILSSCWLSLGATKNVTPEDVQVVLDNELSLTLPPCRIVIENIAGEQAYQTTHYPLKIEAYSDSHLERKIQTKLPIIQLSGEQARPKAPLILRMKAQQSILELTNTYLLNDVMPIRKRQAFRKAAASQEVILSRADDQLAYS